MTPSQINHIQTTFAQVQPIAETTAALFYRRLFELDPSLVPLFRGDMVRQGRKLMAILRLVVNHLDHLEGLVSVMQELGRRHAIYGVQTAHYETVAAALLWTLRQELGTQFTPEVEAAWREAYAMLAETMVTAGMLVLNFKEIKQSLLPD